MADYDLAVIGGGINGAGIARDAAGRGLRVLLVEQSDLASGTSSASTKLIHGGLRYLEQYAFRLVREALIEREVLLRMAPHIVRPLRFVLPAEDGGRSPLLLRAGLFLYDHIGGRKILPPAQTLDLTHDPAGAPLKRVYRTGFAYSDCWVDDARLVALNALDASERGADIRTRTRCVRAERDDEWRLILNARGVRSVVTARALVNATGPWVAQVDETIVNRPQPGHVRLVKGSHIVVPRLFEHDDAYIFQNKDSRVVFAIPYERDFTLVGTTDTDFRGDVNTVTASAEDIRYLRDAVYHYFRHATVADDVVWSFAGVRALYDDGSRRAQDVTRDYHLALDEPRRKAPLLTVYGGKITTYRKLAEAALQKLSHFFALGPRWTAQVPLPGGDFPFNGVPAQVAAARARWPFLQEETALRLVRAYGTRIGGVLGDAKAASDLGADFGHGFTAAEIDYLLAHEFAQDADDILWRRSKLGLHMNPQQRETVAQYIRDKAVRGPAAEIFAHDS